MSSALLSLHVKPGATTSQIVGWKGEVLKGEVLEVRIAAPPREGKANAALIEFLARALRIAPSNISLVRGHTARHKQVAVGTLDQEEVLRRLGRLE